MSLMVIMKGSCFKKAKIVQKDTVLGDDFILVSENLKDSSCPRTITFLEVMKLHRDQLMDVASKFPDFDRKLRRAQCVLAVWRAIIYTADQLRIRRRKAVKQQRDTGKKPGCMDLSFLSNAAQ